MFSLTVQVEFCAAHALIIAGQRETIHGHNFRVTACIEGNALDSDGLLCDFHTVESFLQELVEPFINANLNALPPFDTLNPTAENIAKYLADELHTRLGESLAPAARVAWVSITEAPGCLATYHR
jgi:6-pyruvoyltetrahydropterin/6-carboxytetrahydropterin synthase